MKRRITTEDLMQLTEEQQQKLRELWKDNFENGDYACNEVGGEFFAYNLTESDGKFFIEDMTSNQSDLGPEEYDFNECLSLLDIGQMIELLCNEGGMKPFDLYDYATDDLCDALFKEIKEVL